jgi:hypothetical protein
VSRVDHQIRTEALFATVEFKGAHGPVTSSWTVTGIGTDNFPCLALSVSVPLMAKTEEDSITEANQLFRSHIEPLALKSLTNGGLHRSSEKVSDPSNP